MARKATVTVYESRIEAAFHTRYGTVRRNVERVAFVNLGWAQKFAPVRTGKMRNSLYRSITPHGKYELRYHISTHEVIAPYAIHTLRGTTGPIYPSNSKFLWVRPKPYSWYFSRTPRISVEGQVGKDWLGASVRATFHVEGLGG